MSYGTDGATINPGDAGYSGSQSFLGPGLLSSEFPAAEEERDQRAEISFWKNRIEKRKLQSDFVDWEKTKKQAREFYKGNLLEERDRADWAGDTVELNLWRRIFSFFVDAIFSTNPNIAVRPSEGRNDDKTLGGASAVEAFLKYVWREKRQRQETKRALKDSWFGNVAAAKLDFDHSRGLWAMRWVSGVLIVDSECHGDLSRAQWIAEEMQLPALRILQDDSFPLEQRQKLAQKWGSSISRNGDGGFDSNKKLWYVYTREGANPVGIVRELIGEASPEEGSKKKLLVICEDLDEFLMEEDDPVPFLDEDEYPFAIMQLEELPGEWFGSPPWKMVWSLVNALNWLMSYTIQDMKKKATDIILVNKQIVKNPNKLATDAHMTIEGVDGDPHVASARLDIGKGDMTALTAAERIMEWLDKISGFNEISRGESTGRKTAEEARYLQQNTSLVSKGPTQSLDQFLEECLRLTALASLYYVPAWSRKIGPDGTVITTEPPQPSSQGLAMPAPPGVPGVPPGQPGQPPLGMPPQPPPPMGPPPPMMGTPPPTPAPEDEARALGAEEIPGYGLRMPGTVNKNDLGDVDEPDLEAPGVPEFTHPNAGDTLRRGIDFFMGPEVAAKWPTQPLDDIKRDFLFSFEAGSTRADFRHDQQQAAIGAFQLLGPIYQSHGFGDQLYELLIAYTKTLPLSQTDRLIPTRHEFIQAFQMVMQQQQAAQAAEAQKGSAAQPPPDPAKMAGVQVEAAKAQSAHVLGMQRLALDAQKMRAEMAPHKAAADGIEKNMGALHQGAAGLQQSVAQLAQAVATIHDGAQASSAQSMQERAALMQAAQAILRAAQQIGGPKVVEHQRGADGKIARSVVTPAAGPGA